MTVGGYLLTRLAQMGVTEMFGLPGDFNLGWLDLVDDHPSIEWVGNCNELNAAYAADGYARVKLGSLAVVTTTFGVGELSAMNGIAGAFSEMVPVLHIVGCPSTVQQKKRPLLHHTLGDGRFDAYRKAARQITIHQTQLWNKNEAAAQIDEAITLCITKARPVYLMLPTDIVLAEISGERLRTPLSTAPPPNPPNEEAFVLDLIHEKMKEVDGNAIILLDAGVLRQNIKEEVKELIRETGLPVYSTPMGKSAIDETNKRFGGIYIGSLTHPEVKAKVEGAQLILSVGSLQSDFNTGNFTYNIPTRHVIEFHSDYTQVQYARFDGVGMKRLLPKVTDRLQRFYSVANKIQVVPFVNHVPHEESSVISHKWFWPRIGAFLKSKDVIVTETGTANFGIIEVALPPGCMLLSQVLWGSIGWSVGACLGAALAARKVGMERTILFVGDGSLQLTVQELSPMIRMGLKPIIFVINNKGYTIERMIHGKHRKYNDIADWDWNRLLEVMNTSEKIPTANYTVETKADVDALFKNEEFCRADKMQLVNVKMPALDAPEALTRQAELTGKLNTYETPILN